MIHPTIKEGIKPARKKIHTPKENGGRNVEPFSNVIRRLKREMKPPFEDFLEELAEFFIWVSLSRSEIEVYSHKA